MHCLSRDLKTHLSCYAWINLWPALHFLKCAVFYIFHRDQVYAVNLNEVHKTEITPSRVSEPVIGGSSKWGLTF